MKPGVRALGIAESHAGDADRSVLAGAVVRADRVVDGLAFGTCTVGGLDATAATLDLAAALDRADVRHVLTAGVAPAWFNLLDLDRVHERLDRPVVAVSFEASEGLEPALREQFDGAALEARLDRYRALPPRRPVTVGDDRVFVRAAGLSDEHAAAVVRAHTPEGEGRPEPLRVARLSARAVRERDLAEGNDGRAPDDGEGDDR
ncbi:MAG: DUF99 family protein [Haloferacaceae archaeon]